MELAIFESEEAALTAVEYRRNNVASVIYPGRGEHHGIQHWWFCEHGALLSIVYGNMVLELQDGDRYYSGVEDELWAAAMELLIAFVEEEPREDHR